MYIFFYFFDTLNVFKVIQFCPRHCCDSGCKYILFCVNSTYCVQCLVDRDSSMAAVSEVTAAITVLSPSLKLHLKVVQGFNAIVNDRPDSVCIAHWLFSSQSLLFNFSKIKYIKNCRHRNRHMYSRVNRGLWHLLLCP